MTATNETKKRARFNVIHNVTWTMCTSLPNVAVNANVTLKDDTGNAQIREILYNAALEHRAWHFVVMGDTQVTIFADDSEDAEEIGEMNRTWSRRAGDYLSRIEGHRVNRSSRNSGSYSSKEVAPILRRIREDIYPKTNDEIIRDSEGRASSRLYWITTNATRESMDARERLATAALAYALDKENVDEFLRYEEVRAAATKRNTPKQMERYEDRKACADLADKARGEAGKEMALMARMANGWYVKYKGEVKVYEDDALPEQFAKVHALKMVNNDQVLAGLGVKIDDKTFVITVNE